MKRKLLAASALFLSYTMAAGSAYALGSTTTMRAPVNRPFMMQIKIPHNGEMIIKKIQVVSNGELSAAEKDLIALKEKYSLERTEYELRQKTLEEKQGELLDVINNLKSEVSQLESSGAAFAKEKSVKIAEIKRLESRLANEQQALKNLRLKINESNTNYIVELDKYKQKVRVAESTIKQQQETIGQLQKQIEEGENYNFSLNQKINQLREENKKIALLEEERDALRNQVSHTNTRGGMKRLYQKIRGLDNSKEELELKLAKAQKKLRKGKDEKSSLELELKQLRESLAKGDAENKGLKTKLEEVQQALEDGGGNNAVLQAEVDRLTNKLSGVEEELAIYRQKKPQEESKNLQIQSLLAENTTLQSEVLAAKNKITGYLTTINGLKDQFDKLLSEKLGLQKKLGIAKEQLAKKEAVIPKEQLANKEADIPKKDEAPKVAIIKKERVKKHVISSDLADFPEMQGFEIKAVATAKTDWTPPKKEWSLNDALKSFNLYTVQSTEQLDGMIDKNLVAQESKTDKPQQ